MLSSSAVVANRHYLAIVPLGRGSFPFFRPRRFRTVDRGEEWIVDIVDSFSAGHIFSFNKLLVIRQYRSTTGSNWNRKASTKPPKRVLVSLEIIAGCTRFYRE